MTGATPTSRPSPRLEEYQEYWKLGKTDSILGPHSISERPVAQDVAAPEKLSPEDFRVQPDGPTNKDLGADVDLVGPGPAYERWRATPAYQEWLKDSGQTP